MIISNIYGGLGNQMFQYAIGRKISHLHDVEYKLDISKMNSYNLRDFLLNNYNIKNSIATPKEIKKFKKIDNKYFSKIEKKLFRRNLPIINNIYYEKKEHLFDAQILQKKRIYLEGYWQTYKYFDDIRNILINDFTFKEELNFRNLDMLRKIQNLNSISLHIRRGDYINNIRTNNIYGTCSLDYYKQAIELINLKINKPTYFIFSDDINWAKENLQIENEKIYVDINDGSTPYYDLELMKYCKHNIIANSTFSWWGAWLNINQDKIVIAPKKWMNIKRDFSGLIPKEWIKI